MNERIQELAQQAFINAGYDTKDELFDILFKQGTEFHEKFAELIVQECGEVAYKAYWDNPETVRGIHIKEKIKKHFGVEK